MKLFYSFIVFMKKNFLIIALLTVVFLWLGNSYAANWKNCLATPSTVEWHIYTCELPTVVPAVCDKTWQYAWQSCLAFGSSDCPWQKQCCICKGPPIATPAAPAPIPEETAGCTAKKNDYDTKKTAYDTCVAANQTDPTTACATQKNAMDSAKDAYDACAGVIVEWLCSKAGNDLRDKPNSKNTIVWCDCVAWFKKVDKECKSCDAKWVCCGIELNTNVPFIGKCIEDTADDVWWDETGVTADQAFPVLMWSLVRIMVTIILIVSFVLIVVGGIQIASAWSDSWAASSGRKLIMKVVIGIALLGASWVILRLINPNFFG